MKKGIELRKTVKNERFIIRAKMKTIKVLDENRCLTPLHTSPCMVRGLHNSPEIELRSVLCTPPLRSRFELTHRDSRICQVTAVPIKSHTPSVWMAAHSFRRERESGIGHFGHFRRGMKVGWLVFNGTFIANRRVKYMYRAGDKRTIKQ